MRARRPLALAATGLALALTLSACSTGGDHGTSMTAGGNAGASASATGRAGDVAFAQLMIPHHEQAILMADQAMTKTTNPEIRQLAQDIRAAQDPEIEQMKSWLSSWGEPQEMQGATTANGSMDHSSMDMGGVTSEGMMGEEELQKLDDATGKDFDRTWLQMMIAHHQGAISMANEVIATTTDPQVKELADAVAAGQMEEVSTMQALLAT